MTGIAQGFSLLDAAGNPLSSTLVPAPGGQPNLLSFNLGQVLGNPLGGTNAVIVENNLQTNTINGRIYTASFGFIASAAQTSGLSIFNSSTAKNALIFAALVYNSAATATTVTQVFKTTVNPALGTAVTPINHNFGSGSTSLMTCSSASSGVSITGTSLIPVNENLANPVLLLPPGVEYFLPQGNNTGLAVSVTQSAGGGEVSIVVFYAEF